MRRAITLLPAVVTSAALLAGCGGDDGGNVPLEDPNVLLDSAAAHPVRSAEVQGQAKLTLDGSSVLSQPVTLRVEGPYVGGGGVRIPSFDWKFNLKVLGYGVGGKLVSTGENVFVSPFGDNYEVGRDAVSAVNQRIDASPVPARELFGTARNEGNEEVDGAETQHVSAEIEGKKVSEAFRPLRDALGLTHFPAPVGRIGAWVGVDDRMVHKLTLDADFGVAPADRPRLGGAGGGNLQVEVVLDQINEPQSVHVPGGGGFKPIRRLLLTLNDLGVPVPY